MELLELMRRRRSVRTYSDEPIPTEKLDAVLQAAALAPSSRNQKPCSVYPVTDRAILSQLAAAKAHGAAFTANAGAAVIVAADSEKADTWIEDSAISLTYMMLAAEEQALGCCWVQMHLRCDAEGCDAEVNIRRILDLPEHFRVVGFLTLGVKA